MTEKRFTIIDGIKKGTHSGIWDKQKQHNQGIGDELWLGEVVAMLNEGVILAEENEQLKKQLKCSREEADDYCEELMGKDEFVRLYKRQRDDALKENKQLKSDNNRLVNETAKVVAEHQKKILDLIDRKIEYYSDKYELYDTNAIEVLEELKKELSE